MTELTSAQRARLRTLAHELEAFTYVGKRGVTEAVVQGLEEALLAHELVKVKLAGEREERSAQTLELASRTEAAIVASIGRVAILYRPHPEPQKRRISPD